MRYKKGDIVTLKSDFVLITGGTIKKGTKGTVKEVKNLLKQYKVDFGNITGVWLGDSDLE